MTHSTKRQHAEKSIKSFKMAKIALSLILLSVVIGISGCGKTPKPRTQQGNLDTPAHHVMRGHDLIQQNKWSVAQKQFDLALQLKTDYAPAFAGKALVLAHQSKQDGRTEERVNELRESAQINYESAQENTENYQEEWDVKIVGIRFLTELKSEDWLENVASQYDSALELSEDHPDLQKHKAALHFYTGEAHLAAQSFGKAADQFRMVLSLNTQYTGEANQRLELLDKIVRAQPGTRYGKTMAMVAEVSRADIAALLIEEFHLADLYARLNSSGKKKNNFESPVKKFNTVETRKIPDATDITNHPLKEDILEILKLKVRGLEANPQHLFFPNQKITRAEYALMLEDVLIQVTQDASLATKFVGDTSPWQDVRADAYYFNAARTLTSRNIIGIKNRIRGEFGPNEKVHGADVLLSLRLLKDELKSYVR